MEESKLYIFINTINFIFDIGKWMENNVRYFHLKILSGYQILIQSLPTGNMFTMINKINKKEAYKAEIIEQCGKYKYAFKHLRNSLYDQFLLWDRAK